MSLSRLMLRVLACVALQKQDDDTVAPTMADERVFDSRVDPLVFRNFHEPMPAAIVYTDDDAGESVNQSGAPLMRRVVDLRVELVMGSCGTVDGEQALLLPLTDAELEARLDLFEAQVRWALLSTPARSYSSAFAAYVVRVLSIDSHATRDESGERRFASRVLHLKTIINDDCQPVIGLADGVAPDPDLIPFCDKLDAFPAPWIRPMLQAMCASPSMRQVLSVLTGTPNSIAVLPLLKRIGVNVDAIDPEADPNLLSEQGKSHGPDGRIEVSNLLEFP